MLTIQALAEFYHATTRKRLVPQDDAAGQVRDWLELFPTAAADAEALRSALQASEGGQLAFWDALLLATAGHAGCTVVLSGYMDDGATLDQVTVLDPFRESNLPAPVAALLRLQA